MVYGGTQAHPTLLCFTDVLFLQTGGKTPTSKEMATCFTETLASLQWPGTEPAAAPRCAWPGRHAVRLGRDYGGNVAVWDTKNLGCHYLLYLLSLSGRKHHWKEVAKPRNQDLSFLTLAPTSLGLVVVTAVVRSA